MDFYLDTLLNLPQVTVFTCQQQEGFILLKWLSPTCDDNKILYFVGWVRRGSNFYDKPISFDSRRNPLHNNM